MNILDILDREGLRIATDDKRILAFVIDDIIIGLIIFMGFYDSLMILEGDIKKITELLSSAFLYIITLKIAYHSIFTAIYGASVGKILCKIKIIKIDTLDKPNIIEAISRSMLRILAELLLYIPLLIAFADPFRRAMHDLLVKTIVIDVSAPQDFDYTDSSDLG